MNLLPNKQSGILGIVIWFGLLLLVLIPVFIIITQNASNNTTPNTVEQEVTEDPIESEPLQEEPSPTPQPTMTSETTATWTLLPPPTFEPATHTPTPSPEPQPTEIPTLDLSVDDLDINGLETPTSTAEVGCEPRDDWQLTYQVQAFDTLSSIADLYSTTIFALADGNCMDNPDVISIGQTLRVPGDAPPAQPEYECVPWEVLTPINNAFDIDGAGQLTFVWRGVRAPRNLVRVYDSSGNIALEVNVDLAQNATISLPIDLPNAGVYTWYVYPLDWNFQQIPCPEGGPWTFHKNDGTQ